MDEFEFEIPEGFSLNYQQIYESTKLMMVTRSLAKKLMDEGYISVGDYIKGLSDGDLKSLVDKLETNDLEDVVLIGELLASGEGIGSSQEFNTFSKRLNQFAGFLVIESLHRKGFVKVYHENISFGDDMGNKLVVERL